MKDWNVYRNEMINAGFSLTSNNTPMAGWTRFEQHLTNGIVQIHFQTTKEDDAWVVFMVEGRRIEHFLYSKGFTPFTLEQLLANAQNTCAHCGVLGASDGGFCYLCPDCEKKSLFGRHRGRGWND